jgi:integrase
LLKKHFASWLDRRLDKITVDDVLTVKNACGKHKHMANRCVEFARAIFNWSAGKNDDGRLNFWSVANPAKDVGTFDEDPRERFLQPEELVRFKSELEKEKHADLKDFLALALSTGARRSSIFAMRWDDVKWERQVWTVPDSDSKNGQGYSVQLLPAALAVLKRRRADIAAEVEHVFPGIGKSKHLVDLKKPWNEFRKRARLSDVRLHDLRRTHGSYLAIAGVSLQQIGASLGHKSLQSTEVYAKLHDEAVRAAGETGEAKMAEMMKKARRRIKLAECKPKMIAAVAGNGSR